MRDSAPGSAAPSFGAPAPVSWPSVRERSSLRYALGFQALALVLDVIAVFVAFYAAHQLRYNVELGGAVREIYKTQYSDFTTPSIAAALLLVAIFPTRGIYQIRRRMTLLDYFPRIVSAFAMVVAGVILLSFFLQITKSRLIFIYLGVFGVALMMLHRWILQSLRIRLMVRGHGVDRVLLVGEGPSSRRLMQSFMGDPTLGYRLIGFVSSHAGAEMMRIGTERGVLVCPRLGTLEQLGDVVRKQRIDEVLIVEQSDKHVDLPTVINLCRDSVVQFRLVPDMLQISLDRVDVSEINGVPTIGIRGAAIQGWNSILKRGADILISAFVLAVLAIPMVVIAVLIVRDSPGGVFYRHTRVGRYGRPFTMIKFRAMVKDADKQWEDMATVAGGSAVQLFKDRNDPRITKVGRVLRRYSLDELPQLFNVVRGQMSIIGPRPPLPREVMSYEEWHLQRLLVRPGITGLWQVNGRSDLPFDEMVRLDLYYAENWSPGLDVKILLRTIPAVVFARGAY